jgi:hypothetical protein
MVNTRAIIESVRAPIASVLALLILLIATADPLCCADGCEQGSLAATHSTQTGADCPTCLSAVLPLERARPGRPEAATQLTPIAQCWLLSTFQTDLDHPPRRA